MRGLLSLGRTTIRDEPKGVKHREVQQLVGPNGCLRVTKARREIFK